MIRMLVLALAVFVVSPPGIAVAASLPDTIERVVPSIVIVGTYERLRQPAGDFRGTGFAVGDGAYVLTNAHVVPESKQAEDDGQLGVFLGRGQNVRFRAARVVARDARHDMALLRMEGKPIAPLELGDSDKVRAGERYVFTGFPIGMILGAYPVTHEALISSVTPIAIPQGKAQRLDPATIKRLGDPYEVFQLDATAYPGNSGSPLYDPETGHVKAVLNMVFVKGTKENVLKEPTGIAYAIPIRYGRALLERVRNE